MPSAQSMKLKTVKNTATVALSIVHEGHQFVLQAHDEATYEDIIADKFLALHSPVAVDVTLDEQTKQTYAPEFEADTMWIANMTGNPDAQKEITVSRYTKQTLRIEKKQVLNPNAEPRTFTMELKGGHRQYFDRDGAMVQKSLPSRYVSVPPFKRRPVKTAEARWLLECDSACEDGRGALIESRPPSAFEPDMTWALRDMRAYLRLTDPNADLGPDESHLAEKIREEKMPDAQATETLRSAKQLVLRRLFFRLVDPKYALPDKKTFQEFTSGKSTEQINKEELAALLEQSERSTRSGMRKLAEVAKQ